MSGLAHLLLDRGCVVSGSDLKPGMALDELAARGMRVFLGHDPAHVAGADLVVYSSAVRTTNSELKWSVQSGLPTIKRAAMLAELIRGRTSVLVAGTHGKTTSTLMMASILRQAGRNPGYYIGAAVPGFGPCAAWGAGDEFVLEADESDGSISGYQPAHTLLLNIEEDHLDHFGTFNAIVEIFRGVVDRTSGTTVLCADDPVCRLLAEGRPGLVSYALDHEADYRATGLQLEAERSSFTVYERDSELGTLTVSLPGRHNVSNALGAVAMARALGVAFEDCQRALAALRGASRRFDIRFRDGDYLVVDDYAHHPSEIRATLAAVRRQGARRVIALFQPHRYSRTRHLLGQFTNAFADADRICLTEIYGAGEDNPTGVTSADLARELRHAAPVELTPNLRQARSRVASMIEQGDAVVTMGAGDVNWVADDLAAVLRLAPAFRACLDPDSALRVFEPMARHTTLRVGGPADLWVEPATLETLARLLVRAGELGVPVTVVGRGSNLLVRDLGLRGLTVHLARGVFTRLEVEGVVIRAGAGVRLRQIAYAARKAGLSGLEFMEGIPGNLGGSLRMNAGAMGRWMFDVVESVQIMEKDGSVHEVPAAELGAGYRQVPGLDGRIALGATLRGTPAALPEIDARLQAYSARRWSSQPAAPSAGCTFKNDPSIPAGKLIDELGLKGLSVGGARISPVHANFIVNEGGATARDILALIERIRSEVRSRRGLELEPEIQIVGEAEDNR
jgi:UDP-N-acetylmuramate--L-alanine ligase/UDP-N-acetylenolpyruvoylglucosamine reductase